MTYGRNQLKLCEGARVPDLVGDDCRLLFVGINPGLWTAATGLHFAHPSNRFYPALVKARIIEREINVRPLYPSVPLVGDVARGGSETWTALNRSAGMTDDDRSYLVERGLGITNLVERATARASALTAEELRAGRVRLEAFVERHRPKVVAVAGITAYRTAFADPGSAPGLQAGPIGGSELWVVPNPSGLNAHETIDTLAAAYRDPALAAGVIDVG